MTSVLVIAPHPDDETLGCGGTLLKHRANGDVVNWMIVTNLHTEIGFTEEQITRREGEIGRVAEHFGFATVQRLGFPAAQLELVERGKLIQSISAGIKEISPSTVYVPHVGDAHGDHRVVAASAAAALKWFRVPFVRSVLAYETLSETDFNPNSAAFKPNVYVDIGGFLEDKVDAMKLYPEEMGEFPFPRSEIAMRAQATMHGAACGRMSAEAFMLLKEVR